MFCRYSELTIFMNNEQSVVILWVSWCKNKSFWQRLTCTDRRIFPRCHKTPYETSKLVSGARIVPPVIILMLKVHSYVFETVFCINLYWLLFQLLFTWCQLSLLAWKVLKKIIRANKLQKTISNANFHYFIFLLLQFFTAKFS